MFQKYKKDIIVLLNIAIVFLGISLIANFIVDVGSLNLDLKRLASYAIVAVISLGLLLSSRKFAKEEKISGGFLTLILGILLTFGGELIGEILGIVFIVMSAYDKFDYPKEAIECHNNEVKRRLEEELWGSEI